MSQPTVYLWRDRFQAAGVLGLIKDAPRPGRRLAVSPEQIAAVVEATLHTTPPDATHWSVRTMAKAQGLSHAVIHRIWRAHGLQPHRVETFKLSRDPAFVKKLRDVVGVYLHPPDKALVFCVDEKPQVQALDRTEPVLPLRPGQGFLLGRPTTTSATAPPTCSPPLTSWMEPFWPAAPLGNATPSSWRSWRTWIDRCPRAPRFT